MRSPAAAEKEQHHAATRFASSTALADATPPPAEHGRSCSASSRGSSRAARGPSSPPPPPSRGWSPTPCAGSWVAPRSPPCAPAAPSCLLRRPLCPHAARVADTSTTAAPRSSPRRFTSACSRAGRRRCAPRRCSAPGRGPSRPLRRWPAGSTSSIPRGRCARPHLVPHRQQRLRRPGQYRVRSPLRRPAPALPAGGAAGVPRVRLEAVGPGNPADHRDPGQAHLRPMCGNFLLRI